MARQVKSGVGWRLGWDADAIEFQGLIGGDTWSVELTAAELDDFCRLALQLSETIAAIAEELMDEEKINCEAESELIWLEAEGYSHAYELHVIVLTGRRSEGFWPASAVPELLKATQLLRVF